MVTPKLNIEEKTKQLTNEIEELEQLASKKLTRKFSLPWVTGLVVPVFIFLLLFLTKPNVVTKEENGFRVRSWKKLRKTTLALTLILYCIGFVYSCYRSHTTSISIIPEVFYPSFLL